MTIKLSPTIKRLRAKKGVTQEELAAYLGISSQAVSKWERDEGYPDITLLPKIAGFFHVSVDTLLGVDEIAKEQRICEIQDEYNRIRHHIPMDADYRLDEGIDLVRNALHELPGEFFFEQLLAADLWQKSKHMTNEDEKKAIFEEAIILCRDILDRSTEQRWRHCASTILLVIYADMGKTSEALDLAYQMGTPWTTCDYMLTYILKGEELLARYRLNAVLYYKIFADSIRELSKNSLMTDLMIHTEELQIQGIDTDEYRKAIDNVLKNRN